MCLHSAVPQFPTGGQFSQDLPGCLGLKEEGRLGGQGLGEGAPGGGTPLGQTSEGVEQRLLCGQAVHPNPLHRQRGRLAQRRRLGLGIPPGSPTHTPSEAEGKGQGLAPAEAAQPGDFLDRSGGE